MAHQLCELNAACSICAYTAPCTIAYPCTSRDIRRNRNPIDILQRYQIGARPIPWMPQASGFVQSQLVEQAVQLVERAEGDGDFALFAALGLAVHADVDCGGEAVGELLFKPHQIA